MKCTFTLIKENITEEAEFEGDTPLSDLMLACGIIPDTVIIELNGRIIPEDELAEEAGYDIITTASRG
ncbi:thiamine S protein [Methanoplanus endosymbiosus]|uniref:Thiamine S protein n=1 Tax=Methanoplanus endosymbiosus TaxID=33865 RepID=A0A9E7PJS3_9EURY|nr:thiamine S protein [Methanoplanus endosymbiosus]UUX91128.1 thiamine S protein [Methanoplanus endosymbiosus]